MSDLILLLAVLLHHSMVYAMVVSAMDRGFLDLKKCLSTTCDSVLSWASYWRKLQPEELFSHFDYRSRKMVILVFGLSLCSSQRYISGSNVWVPRYFSSLSPYPYPFISFRTIHTSTSRSKFALNLHLNESHLMIRLLRYACWQSALIVQAISISTFSQPCERLNNPPCRSFSITTAYGIILPRSLDSF